MDPASDFILASLQPATYVAVAGVCFGAAILSGMSGFGTGLTISIFIAPIIGVKAVVPVLSVLMLINNASRVWVYYRDLQLRTLVPIVATAAPASALGAWLYVKLDDAMIAAALGGVLIASVPVNRWLARRNFRIGHLSLSAGGAVFGFLSSVVVGAGMLLLPLLLGAGLAGPALLATDAAIAVLVNLVKMPIFGGFQALTPDLLLAGLLMGLCTVPGTWVAAWVVRRTDLRIHRVFMELVVIVGGASFLWRALAG